MSVKRKFRIWFGLQVFACMLAVPGTASKAFDEGETRVRVLNLSDVKVQWFSGGEEDLPAWINAHFEVGPLGGVSGRLVETDLAGDGVDDDGDPAGFDAKVYETADGSMFDVSLGRDSCVFTTVLGPDSGQATYRLRHVGAPSAWELGVAQKGPRGLYFGHNRFPLEGSIKKGGVLEIGPSAGTDTPDDPSSRL